MPDKMPHPVQARCRLGAHFCTNPAKAPGELCWFHQAPDGYDPDLHRPSGYEDRLAEYREAAGTS